MLYTIMFSKEFGGNGWLNANKFGVGACILANIVVVNIYFLLIWSEVNELLPALGLLAFAAVIIALKICLLNRRAIKNPEATLERWRAEKQRGLAMYIVWGTVPMALCYVVLCIAPGITTFTPRRMVINGVIAVLWLIITAWQEWALNVCAEPAVAAKLGK